MLTGGTAVGVVGCGGSNGSSIVNASDEAVERREQDRRATDARVVRAELSAVPMQLDLAGRVVETWGYSRSVLRATAGDILEVQLSNELPETTTVHWHGLALRNDMDGMQDVTQQPIARGESFTYRFVAPDPGTFFFHPHVGLQLDRALYAPLIVDDPDETGAYDVEHVLVLDDWLDGIDGTPERAFGELTDTGSESMGGWTTGR